MVSPIDMLNTKKVPHLQLFLVFSLVSGVQKR